MKADETYMMGENKIQNAKLKSIFKKPTFWASVLLLFFFNAIRLNLLYVYVSIPEYVGILLGSFIICFFISSVMFYLSKFILKRKLRKNVLGR